MIEKLELGSIHISDRNVRLVWNTTNIERCREIMNWLNENKIDYYVYTFIHGDKRYKSVRINKLEEIKKYTEMMLDNLTITQRRDLSRLLISRGVFIL